VLALEDPRPVYDTVTGLGAITAFAAPNFPNPGWCIIGVVLLMLALRLWYKWNPQGRHDENKERRPPKPASKVKDDEKKNRPR
jgi:hypothetical protein